MSELKFIDGLFVDKPSEQAPKFVIAKLSIGQKFIEFYEKNKNSKGYVNCDMLESKTGKYYLKLNTWKPTKQEEKSEEINLDEIPF